MYNRNILVLYSNCKVPQLVLRECGNYLKLANEILQVWESYFCVEKYYGITVSLTALFPRIEVNNDYKVMKAKNLSWYEITSNGTLPSNKSPSNENREKDVYCEVAFISIIVFKNENK